MKKYLFLAALVGVAFTSCVRNEEFAPKTQKEISFEVANYVQSTRVGAFDPTESFGAYVWHNDGAATPTLTLMNDAAATVSYSDSKWAPTPTLYWPTTGSVDCLAFYPTTVAPTPSGTGYNTLSYNDYVVKNVAEGATADPTHDVKYADRAYRYTANVSYEGFTGIPTLFNHALAKLNFKVSLDDQEGHTDVVWTAEVTKITVDGVYNTGDLELTSVDPTGDAKQGTWTLPSPAIWTKVGDTKAAARNWAQTVALAEGEVKTFDASETYYVLPQEMEDGVQTCAITYSLTQKAGGISTTNTYTKTFDFYDSTLKTWEMNKNITYTLTIVPHTNKILFAPAVSEWVDADGSITVQ